MNEQPTDHDLLIRLAERVENITDKITNVDAKVDKLSQDVRDLKDNTAARIENLEKEKLDTNTFNRYQSEHERIHDLHIADSGKRENRIVELEQKTGDYTLIRTLVFGCVGLILIAFMSVVILYVIPNSSRTTNNFNQETP